ncbi:MAG TPA: hypothetical protein VKA84_04070 [Gemmatimonadaceae bacterium]|nr:hypothetical protein [Gemmatimonadaceae bacterium]
MLSLPFLRRARWVLAALLALSSSAAAPAGAQSLSGVRARLWSGQPPLQGAVGTIYSLGADTMLVTLDGHAAPVAVPLASVLRLQVSRRDRADNVARWLRWGLLGGAVAGVAYGASRSAESEGAVRDRGCSEGSRCDHAVRYGLGGTALGAIVGGIFGAATGTERWEEVRLPSRTP